jgi:hypothetical protein
MKKHRIVVRPLSDIMRDLSGDFSKLVVLLKRFVCKQDKDIQNFLRCDAIRYEITGKSRTYLFIDAADPNGHILGYFTLSINSITFSKRIDNKVKRILDYEADRKQFKYMKKPFVPAILLALFGKDTDKYDQFLSQIKNKAKRRLSDISMPIVFDLAKKAKAIIGGQVIYLDCEKDKKLIKFYENFNFTHFRNNEYDKNLTQMMRVIN